MRNVYSGAGAKPRTGPLPKSSGLRYNDPLPGGGTYTLIIGLSDNVRINVAHLLKALSIFSSNLIKMDTWGITLTYPTFIC